MFYYYYNFWCSGMFWNVPCSLFYQRPSQSMSERSKSITDSDSNFMTCVVTFPSRFLLHFHLIREASATRRKNWISFETRVLLRFKGISSTNIPRLVKRKVTPVTWDWNCSSTLYDSLPRGNGNDTHFRQISGRLLLWLILGTWQLGCVVWCLIYNFIRCLYSLFICFLLY